MNGIDFIGAGFGLMMGEGTVGYFVAYAYCAKAIAQKSVARFSALEKLIDIYGPKLDHKKFLKYASAMNLIDYAIRKEEEEK